ncbi:hypothetical protein FM996_13615 [Methylosinus sporium]|uniref:DUF3619 family protein n=1 Tax=Methylosinus sporium TaxID=428 RepID=A0A549SP81_METSR|nr:MULTISPECIES: hypothetical protein [Methylosinus]MBU3887672.1 hypothetical protein [Methylosinus sp. KRF6]TRL31436.1 hypothetical protein FM996_13615 [Methylosinus sporium]
MEADARAKDEALRKELRASLRVLRSKGADGRPLPPRIAPRLVVVAPQRAADEPLPAALRILVSAALAAILLLGVSALSDAAAHAMNAMERRSIASLDTSRSHFGFGQ